MQKRRLAIVGILFDVHNHHGSDFLKVYKDTIEYELKTVKIPFQREKEYKVYDKDSILPHKFYADFVVFDKIILELKCAEN